MPVSLNSPLSEYRARLERFTAADAINERRYRQLSNARLATGLGAVVLAGISIGGGWISPWWLLCPVVVFIGLAIAHDRVARARKHAAQGVAFYQKGLGRLQHTWVGKGNQGDKFRQPAHLYADDLDIFGAGSLFELLASARTKAGERQLADWLLTPSAIEAVRARQQAVQELTTKLDLREEMALLGDGMAILGDPARPLSLPNAASDEPLRTWGTNPAVKFFPGVRWVALLLALAALAAFALFMLQVWPSWPLLMVILAEVIFGMFVRAGVVAIVASVASFSTDLRTLGRLLARLEQEAFAAPRLQEIARGFAHGAQSASAEIQALEKWVDRLDWVRNPFFALASLPLLWMPQCAFAIELWRQRNGTFIGAWVAAVAEFEALCSLSAFAYERPDAVFPELLLDGPVFHGLGVRHPLIDPAHAIANDVELRVQACPMWIISGSNMSGKSTLLRAVGLNTVLAWAGAPVCCASLQVSSLKIGASIRVNDSLADNKSRFYAEISRLRDVVNLTKGDSAVLFLLDELLSGTNSHDRRLGAAAVVKGLVERGAIGMVTTHDLALAEIAAGLNARNVHFEDHLEDGQMRFDYRLKPGVVQHSNALALMRAVGLDV